MIGKTISHYKILDELGHGGMGIVYKAEDTRLHRTVALKFLPPHLLTDDEAKARFTAEAQAASALDHQNICTIHQIDQTSDGQLFIVMACYDGQTLQDLIETQDFASLPIEKVIDITSQIAAGLARAHEAGIIHRDIKPSNIIITERGEVKILDFGIAKLRSQQTITKTGSTLGTAAYMSPEQVKGDPVDHRTDLWSLGVILYEMLAGRRPFDAEYDQAVMYQIVNAVPPGISSLRPDLPLLLVELVQGLLAKHPDDRLDDLTALQSLQSEKAHLSGVVRPAKRGTTSQKARPLRALLTTLLLVLLAVVATVSWRLGNNDGIAPESTIHQNSVMVLPFALHGSDSLAYLREGMIDLLSMKFDGAGELRRIDPAVVFNQIRHNQTDLNDPGAIEAVANTLGAEYFVRGNIYDIGGKMRFTASLHRTGEGVLASAESQTGVSDDLYQLIDDLGRQLLVFSSDTSGSPVQQLARRTTQSATALKAYLAGEARLRSEEYTKAMEYFQQAIAHDSTFALAYFRLARTSGYQGPSIDRAFLLEKAMQYSSQLSIREQLLFEALYNYVVTRNFKKTIALCRQILTLYPGELEVWSIYFEALEFYGPRLGEPIEIMQMAANRCYELGPDNALYLAYLASMAERNGDIQNIIKFSKMRLQLSPNGSWAPFERRRLAFIEGDVATKQKILQELQKHSATSAWFLSRSIAMSTANPEDHEAVASLLKRSGNSDIWQARGAQVSAYFAMSRGQRTAALKEMKIAESFFDDYPIDEKALYLLIPYADATEAMIRKQIQNIRYWQATRAWIPKSGVYADPDQSMAFIRRNYALGLLFCELKDIETANLHADSLAKFQEHFSGKELTQIEQKMASALASSVRAFISFQSGMPENAIKTLEQPNLDWCANFRLQFVDAQLYERFLRARCYRALGQYEDAIRWLSTIGTFSYPAIAYRAPKHRLLAEIYEEIGDKEQAIEHYQRFIELWRDCDPELRPQLEIARARIDALRQ